MYKNTEFKDSSMDMKEVDTHFNTSENVTEVKKDAWRENHQPPVTKDSDFTLHRVNDGDMASKIGIKIKSLSGPSKILEMTGNYYCSIESRKRDLEAAQEWEA